MTLAPLAPRLLAIHRSLTEANIEFAIGGAVALAYWTVDPRGTSDIDVNIFMRPDECERALAALPAAIAYDDNSVKKIKRDGQDRLWWEDTPIDVFFSNQEIHDQAAHHRRRVPFDGEMIPILGPVELAVFKAMFDRTQDWADIEAMLAAQTLDVDALKDHLVGLVGEDDKRLERVDEAIRRVDR